MDPFHQIRPLLDWLTERIGQSSEDDKMHADAVIAKEALVVAAKQERLALDVWNSKGPQR